MKTVFLFGAGASYGSDASGTPPLGAGLFDELCRFNPKGWGSLPTELANQFRADFELAMRLVAPTAVAPLQREMAAYFFEFKPSTSNLYFRLARRIAETAGWSGAACTLNYDRLLEMSLFMAGIQPVVGDQKLDGRWLELCFPHGCCHIFCDAALGHPDCVTFDAFSVQSNGPVTVVADAAKHRARILGNAFPPVMSYFEPKKQTTSGSSFIEQQRSRWRQMAGNATTIIVVGVRVRTHDDHIWSPVAESRARVVYCAGVDGAIEYESWAALARPGRKDKILRGFFRDEFSAICSEAGL